MAIATFLSRILGLVREQLIASTFGASGLTDAFYVAYRIPNLLRDLFAEGAFSAAFVPIFTESKQKEDSKKTFNEAFWTLAIITSFLSFLIFLAAPYLVNLLAPGFVNDSEKFDLTVLMVRIVSPFLFLISLAALVMGVLNTYKIFFLPAAMPIFLNLSVICSILFLSHKLEQNGFNSILSIAIGILIGGFLQFFLQVPEIIKKGYSFKFPKKLFSKNVKRILYKMGPGALGYSLNQINLIINTILATTAGIGAVSWLNWGFRLFQFPNGVLSVSIGNSHLVHFSELWKQGKKKDATETFLNTLFLSLTLLIPITIIILSYSDWIINIVFERGAFTRNDTFMSAKALFFYSLSLPFYGLYKITVPIFYTIDKERIPVITSSISVLINLAVAFFLIKELGFSALAISASVAIFINLKMQLFFLNKYLDLSISFKEIKRMLIFIIAGILSFVVSRQLKGYLDFYSYSLFYKLILFILISFIILTLYLVSLYLLNERNFIYLLKRKK